MAEWTDGTGGQIHADHPFADPEDDRAPLRRLRGRLPSPVTLWTAAAGGRRAGLTVSSVLIVDPDRLLGVVSDENDLLDLLTAAGRFTVAGNRQPHRTVADAFAFVAPAPGGPFAGHDWQATDWGPVLTSTPTWAGFAVREIRDVGYGQLIEAAVERVELAARPASNRAGTGTRPGRPTRAPPTR